LKIFVLAPQEDWICDRLVNEWYENFPQLSTKNIRDADVIWLLAGWCWNHIPLDILRSKKLVVTEHHIVPQKFSQEKYKNFLARDQFVDCYHVPNEKTKKILSQITSKKIKVISYWLNDAFWRPISKELSRLELNINKHDFCVGSFQRDTEGFDLKTPKLEKGPDLFCDYLDRVHAKRHNLHVLLGGWRRQYVVNRLKKSRIKYTLFEQTNLENIKKLYAACDLYIVSSRYEGGPQALIEAAAMEVPIISTDVGIAKNILPSNCIIDIEKEEYLPTIEDIMQCKDNVDKLKIEIIGEKFMELFRGIKNGS
jgi:glycosyltransferase involved in cell wall biosynthesis